MNFLAYDCSICNLDDVREHADNSRTAQPNTVNLNQNQILLYNVSYPDNGETLK